MMRGFVALHEQTRDYVCPIDRRTLAVRMRLPAGSHCACALVCWNRNRPEEGVRELPMERYARDGMFDYYEAGVSTPEATRYLCYVFRIARASGTVWLNYGGLRRRRPDSGFFEYSYTNDGDVFSPPGWLAGSVFYQIFPDRFCNGDPSNDPDGTLPWGSPPGREGCTGGDLKGIAEKLPHLMELGVNALYLNPVFQAGSNHKYDTIDYKKIDPAFGTAEDLARLVSLCHAGGVKVILDGVFNHCGMDAPMFRDVLERGERSAFGGWFYLGGFPVDPEKLNYETVGYYSRMPKLRLSCEAARRHVLDAAMHWMETAGIDGWRLDVAEEVEYPFWQRFRCAAKAAKADCFLLGETWRENTGLVQGDRMDSVTNYAFRNAVLDFFARASIGAAEFDRRVNRIVGAYSGPALHALFNLIDSHDTERFLTSCGGDVRKMKLAVAFQFGFPGVPAVYYGDETGMAGGPDPGCRGCMEWDRERWDRDLFGWYRRLIGLRRRSRALQSGAFRTVYAGKADGIYAFTREWGGERVLFVMNNRDRRASVRLPAPPACGACAVDLITGAPAAFARGGKTKLSLSPYQALILGFGFPPEEAVP